MASLGFSDLLSVAQTVAIIATLAMTLYFSRRQMKGFALDLETRVLNDLDEKAHNLVELFIGNPQFIRLIYNDTANLSPDIGAAYYIQFMCGHAFRTRQRGVLGDNEWAGWMQWMKNAFRYGTIGKYWKETGMGAWFDPAFREFVDKEILPSASESK